MIIRILKRLKQNTFLFTVDADAWVDAASWAGVRSDVLTTRPRSLSGWSFPHVRQQCSKLHRVQKAPSRLGPILSPSPISRTVFVEVKHRERKGAVPLVPLESSYPTAGVQRSPS